MKTTSVVRMLGTLACVTTATAPVCSAQGRMALSLSGGSSNYDLSGTGTAGTLGGRMDLHLGRVLVVEPGMNVLRYSSQQGSGPLLTYLLPELSVHAQIPLKVIRPFIGAGGGRAFMSNGYGSVWTLHGVLGTRVQLLNSPWGMRAELRVRAVDPSHGVMADVTGGISYLLH